MKHLGQRYVLYINHTYGRSETLREVDSAPVGWKPSRLCRLVSVIMNAIRYGHRRLLSRQRITGQVIEPTPG